MIVELFGPPGAGKTTFAQKIADGLQSRGHAARTLISARPSETAALSEAECFGGRTAAAANARAQGLVDADLDAVNRDLMRCLPPHSLFWRFRLRRYLKLLAASWSQNQSGAEIAIFDQGYTQALCSLTSLTRSADPRRIVQAASLLPAPAVRICVQVPRALLLARQQQRERERPFLERFLELDPATNLAQAGICTSLRTILEGRMSPGGPVPMLCPDPMNEDLGPVLDAVADVARTPTIVREVMAR